MVGWIAAALKALPSLLGKRKDRTVVATVALLAVVYLEVTRGLTLTSSITIVVMVVVYDIFNMVMDRIEKRRE